MKEDTTAHSSVSHYKLSFTSVSVHHTLTKSISTKEISTFNPTTSYPGQHITSTPSNTQHASLLGSKTWQQIKSQIHLTQHIWTIVSSADEQLNSNNKHKNTSHIC